MEVILSTAITGILSLVGVILTNVASNRKIEHRLETQQAVTDTKIEELTREVRMHNSILRDQGLLRYCYAIDSGAVHIDIGGKF